MNTAQSPPKVFPDSTTPSSLPTPPTPVPGLTPLILGWWPCGHSGSSQRRSCITSLWSQIIPHTSPGSRSISSRQASIADHTWLGHRETILNSYTQMLVHR
uniref:(northern house mosquito) hypothetical protein n=1 Tax=Culex pipiens TaxID=7175 RepID=A0A8D8EZ40_CULPI